MACVSQRSHVRIAPSFVPGRRDSNHLLLPPAFSCIFYNTLAVKSTRLKTVVSAFLHVRLVPRETGEDVGGGGGGC